MKYGRLAHKHRAHMIYKQTEGLNFKLVKMMPGPHIYIEYLDGTYWRNYDIINTRSGPHVIEREVTNRKVETWEEIENLQPVEPIMAGPTFSLEKTIAQANKEASKIQILHGADSLSPKHLATVTLEALHIVAHEVNKLIFNHSHHESYVKHQYLLLDAVSTELERRSNQ